MHDETLEDEKVAVDFKALQEDIKLFAKVMKIPQDKAVTALGYIMKLSNQVLSAKEAHAFVMELTKTKKVEELNNDERLLCVTLGLLVRKQPFIASASKLGRNDPCPCNSGAKYKNCCLELAKAHDFKRYYFGG